MLILSYITIIFVIMLVFLNEAKKQNVLSLIVTFIY